MGLTVSKHRMHNRRKLTSLVTKLAESAKSEVVRLDACRLLYLISYGIPTSPEAANLSEDTAQLLKMREGIPEMPE